MKISIPWKKLGEWVVGVLVGKAAEEVLDKVKK